MNNLKINGSEILKVGEDVSGLKLDQLSAGPNVEGLVLPQTPIQLDSDKFTSYINPETVVGTNISDASIEQLTSDLNFDGTNIHGVDFKASDEVVQEDNRPRVR